MQHIIDKLPGARPCGDGYKALCPAHKDWMPSLHISTGSGGRVLMHCFGGCSLEKVLGAMGLTPDDLKGDGSPAQARPQKKVDETEAALRDAVYGGLIERLDLSRDDWKALLARGLPDGVIADNRYRTLSYLKACQAVRVLAERFGDRLLTVPGFLPDEKAGAKLCRTEGLLIPVRDLKGRIIACQVRTGASGAKYVWLSSSEASSGSPCHVPLGVPESKSVVLTITEGPLKADVTWASALRRAVIAVPGVSAWRGCLDVVKALVPVKVQTAFDMDWKTKDGVRQQLEALEEELGRLGYEVERLTWDEKYKGVDDAVAAGAVLVPHRNSDHPVDRGGGPAGTGAAGPVEKSATAVDAPVTLTVTRASDIEPESVDWFWRGWIPYGALTVVEGDPGLGKSTLSVALAAACSRGLPLPGDKGDREPSRVLIMSAEDSIATTILPRLIAAGADLDLIDFLNEKSNGELINFPYDIQVKDGNEGLLLKLLRESTARLWIVDPLYSYFDERIDANKDAQVRRVLHHLHKIATERKIANLLVRHLNKDASKNALYRGSGSIGVTGQARSVLWFNRVPNEENSSNRVLIQIKNNLAPLQRSRLAHLEQVDGSSRLAWGVESGVTPESYQKKEAFRLPKPALRRWLGTKLLRGPQSVTEIVEEAEVLGWKEEALKKARQDFGVKSKKEADGWWWYHPKAAVLATQGDEE